MNQHSHQTQKGFTLIELLLVIGIIAVLAVVVFVALDPAKRFADARDARRISDINSILSAVSQYVIDNKGTIPSGIETTEKQIGTGTGGCEVYGQYCNVNASSCADLSTDLAKYLKTLPYDPSTGSDATTHYAIKLDANNIVTVTSCDTEGNRSFSVSR